MAVKSKRARVRLGRNNKSPRPVYIVNRKIKSSRIKVDLQYLGYGKKYFRPKFIRKCNLFLTF